MNTDKKPTKSKDENFESSLAKIEKIVEEIESGRLPLNEVVAKFKECSELIANCRKILSSVQSEIKVLESQLDKGKK